MGINQLQGTPWHLEKVHRNEDDDRRYKGRCRHYFDSNDHCSLRSGRCMGSAHCDEYEAMSDAEFKEKQEKRRKKSKGEDDCYWY